MLERILRFSIHHRYLVVMLVILAAGVGAYSLLELPIDAVPDITGKGVVITTESPSFSPLEMEKRVTLPLETAVAGIPGLQYTSSFSRNGLSQITCYFEDSVDIYFARTQVTERLREAKEGLPPGVEPKMGAVTTGLGEVYVWTVDFAHPGGKGATARDGLPGWQTDGSYLTPEGEKLADDLHRLTYLRTVQDWIIRPQIHTVKDVADLDIQGGYVKQYVVEPKPMELVARGLTFKDLVDGLQKDQVGTGAGYVDHSGEALIVRVVGRPESIEQIGRTIVGQRNGTPVRVSDVADVVSGREQRFGAATRNGREVVWGTAAMLTGANSRTTAAGVDAKMAEVRKLLPPDVEVTTVVDRTKLVDSTIHTVAKNLIEGAILVVVILLVLLGNIRAAVIAALAIPLSMLVTASGMVASHVSGNLMSLGAIDFGLIVDGAVIIVENCLRMLGERQREVNRKLTTPERLQVVFEASSQVRTATAFGEAIIIIVYLPVLTLQGVEGKMFRPMALTVVLALAAAFVLSLTFVPAMVAIFIRGRVSEKESVLVRAAKTLYEPLLRAAVRLRWVIVAVAVIGFAASLLLYTGFGKALAPMGQAFVPTLDEGDILIATKHVPSTSLGMNIEFCKAMELAILATGPDGKPLVPEVDFVCSKEGTGDAASDPIPMHAADTFIILKPRGQWPNPAKPKDDLQKDITKALAVVPGTSLEFTQPIEDRFNELVAGVRTDLAVRVYGDDFETTVPAATKVKKILEAVPGHAAVEVSATTGVPVMTFALDGEAAGRRGLSRADVADVVTLAVGGREAGVVYEGDRRFNLVVRLSDAVRENLDALRTLPIPLPKQDALAPPAKGGNARDATQDPNRFTSAGGMMPEGSRAAAVPLETFAAIDVDEGPTEIQRQNGRRFALVTCNVAGRDLGSFVAEARKLVDEQVKLPPGKGYHMEWGGQFENLSAARRRLSIVVPVCLLLIFVMLFGTFNSIRHAVMVFSGVPLALVGGIVALRLRGIDFSISAGVGFIALSGVAVLNGLVLVTFINQLRREGVPLSEAVARGSLVRLRPVLMTAVVASLGFVPMAIATGPGSEVQRPLATVVIGGIISSTLLTLFVLPALYRMLAGKTLLRETSEVSL